MERKGVPAGYTQDWWYKGEEAKETEYARWTETKMPETRAGNANEWFGQLTSDKHSVAKKQVNYGPPAGYEVIWGIIGSQHVTKMAPAGDHIRYHTDFKFQKKMIGYKLPNWSAFKMNEAEYLSGFMQDRAEAMGKEYLNTPEKEAEKIMEKVR